MTDKEISIFPTKPRTTECVDFDSTSVASGIYPICDPQTWYLITEPGITNDIQPLRETRRNCGPRSWIDTVLIRTRDVNLTPDSTMSTTTNVAVKALPNTGSLSLHPRSLQTQPSTSAVGLNGMLKNIEMKDRTVTTETAAPSTASVSNTNAHRVRANIQFISLCYSLFLAGWNDGTTGPLLPRIQEVYHVRPVTF